MHTHCTAPASRPWSVRTGVVLASLILTFPATATDRSAVGAAAPLPSITTPKERPHVLMTFGTHRFTVTLDDGPAARAFTQLLPLTLDMPDLNGNEKHVSLPRPLPVDAFKPGTIHAGDVMLYGSDTLVVFYKTFPSGYSYTRIGHVADGAGLARALGAGSQRITFAAP